MLDILLLGAAIFAIFMIFKKITAGNKKQGKEGFSSSSNLLGTKEKESLVTKFEQEMNDGGFRFKAEEFCNFYKIDLNKKRREVRNNPNLLVTMGIGNMFGGAVGSIYTTVGLANVVASAWSSTDYTLATICLYFERDWDSLTADEQSDLKLLKSLQVENVFTNDDFNKAFYSYIWNNGDCSFSGVGKNSEGAFADIELTDNEKLGISLMSGLVKSSVIPIEKTKQIISNNINKLSQENIDFIESPK